LRNKLHAGQQVIYDKLALLPPEARQVVFLCGRRFGKSHLALVLALEACLRKPGSRVLLCAPYIKQASEIAGPLMAKVTHDAPAGLIKRLRSTHRWNFANGSTLILSGLDLVAESIRGQEFDDVICEESGSSNPTDFLYVIQSVLLPTLLKSRGRIYHVSSLSTFEDHPLHTDIMPRADAQGALFSFPTTASPLYTPEQLQEMCDEVGGPKSIAWRREFLNELVRDSGLVAVPEYDGSNVVEFDTPAAYKYWIAADWGGSRDKTVFLLMGYDFKRAKVIVIDEAVFDNKTPTSVIVAGVRVLEERWKLVTPPRYVDTQPQHQQDLNAQFQFATAQPSNRTDKFEVNLNLVRSLIGSIEIHPRCKFLIQTLRYARLDKTRTGLARTQELGHGDGVMALCYGLRHINKNNPYPAWNGADPSTHYIPYQQGNLSSSAQVLKSIFAPK
jgi:hypothetical protein